MTQDHTAAIFEIAERYGKEDDPFNTAECVAIGRRVAGHMPDADTAAVARAVEQEVRLCAPDTAESWTDVYTDADWAHDQERDAEWRAEQEADGQ